MSYHESTAALRQEAPSHAVMTWQDAPQGAETFLPQGLDISFLSDALDHLPAGLALFDKDLRMVYCNSVLRHMLDYPTELFSFGSPTMEQIFRFNATRGEYGDGNVEEFVASRLELARARQPHTYERRRPNGATLEVRGVPLQNGGFATIYLDVSAQKVTAKTPSPHQLGEVDGLTGLPTIKVMRRTIAQVISMLRAGEKACIMSMDLANFGEVNANYGRVVGDYVLREVAIRLASATRGSDFVGRTGGDRFMVVHPLIVRPSDPPKLARRLISEIRRPIVCGVYTIELSATVGFVLADRGDREVDDVIARAQDSIDRVRHERDAGLAPHIPEEG